MLIGKIIKSNSHIDYVCQVYNNSDVANSPRPEDHAFGSFVGISLTDEGFLVGIIYNSLLFNPEFGRFGPRLSPESELAVFSPDYLQEKALLLGIVVVGTLGPDEVIQGVPALSSAAEALVQRLSPAQIRRFHATSSSLQLAYLPLLQLSSLPLAQPLALRVLRQLIPLFPEQTNLLSIFQDLFAWQSQIVPLGGGS